MRTIRRLAIIAALVTTLIGLGDRWAQADQLCVRARTSVEEVVACIPLI